MSRRQLCFILLGGALLFADAWAAGAQAQERETWSPRAGSALLDRQLVDINAYAARYPDAFIDELVRYQDAPRVLLAERIGKRGLTPADAYYACAIAKVTGRPCRSVLDAWEQRGDAGWAELSVRLGVVAGSSEQARVREAIQASYRRWARPLPAAPGQRGTPPARTR